MLVLSNRPDIGPTRLKMLGALAAGVMLGMLVGLPCGREGSVPALCTVVQTLAAVGVPTSVLYSFRRPVEPVDSPDAYYAKLTPVEPTGRPAGIKGLIAR